MLTSKDLDVAYRYIRNKYDFKPSVGVILGSGIPRPTVKPVCEIPFAEVPFMASPTVRGHRGQFVCGYAGELPVILTDGRLHLFEGHRPEAVTLPVRLFARLGCHVLITTGAVGSLVDTIAPGELVVIRDHINLLGASALAGPEDAAFGPRFVSPAGAYDAGLRTLAQNKADALGIKLREAVYVAVPGPAYETAAEAKALAVLGGDVVGMSVADEVLVARQMGLAVLALCAVVNVAGTPNVSHDAVLTRAGDIGKTLTALIDDLLTNF